MMHQERTLEVESPPDYCYDFVGCGVGDRIAVEDHPVTISTITLLLIKPSFHLGVGSKGKFEASPSCPHELGRHNRIAVFVESFNRKEGRDCCWNEYERHFRDQAMAVVVGIRLFLNAENGGNGCKQHDDCTCQHQVSHKNHGRKGTEYRWRTRYLSERGDEGGNEKQEERHGRKRTGDENARQPLGSPRCPLPEPSLSGGGSCNPSHHKRQDREHERYHRVDPEECVTHHENELCTLAKLAEHNNVHPSGRYQVAHTQRHDCGRREAAPVLPLSKQVTQHEESEEVSRDSCHKYKHYICMNQRLKRHIANECAYGSTQPANPRTHGDREECRHHDARKYLADPPGGGDECGDAYHYGIKCGTDGNICNKERRTTQPFLGGNLHGHGRGMASY